MLQIRSLTVLGRLALFVLCTALATQTLAALRLDHPRIWINSADLPRLQAWANPSNPIYQQGIRQLAVQGAQLMDSGALDAGDNAGSTWTLYTTEDYAALFALMSLIDPDTAARPQWASRGRAMLLRIMDSVDTCQRANPPISTGRFCQLSFPVSDRSRWSGHSIALAADWLQASRDASANPILNAADIAKIRRVFLIWSRLSMEAYPNPYNNPPEFSLPVGTIGEPLLRLDTDLRRHRLRFSGNNYFAGHMRNMSMRALAIDPSADVPDANTPATYLRLNGNGQAVVVPLASEAGALQQILSDTLKGWLFVQDYLLRHDSRGGLPQEGLEYMPTSIGIPGQLLLALDSAGLADLNAQAQFGQQVGALNNNPFYALIPEAILQSMSPQNVESGNYGRVFKPAWYGDGEHYYFMDPVDILGALAIWSDRYGDTATGDRIRWALRMLPPDGSTGLPGRTRANGNPGDVVSSIVYFLVFDPTRAASGANPTDPRPGMPTVFWSEGMGRLLARTDWTDNASWFNFRLSYNAVDHQQGDGGMFELYRRGEWLTKGTIGYGNEGGSSDYKNTLTVANTIAPGLTISNFLGNRLMRGAQMPQGRSLSDPSVERRSQGADYHYLRGDMTPLYNAYYSASDPTPVASRALDVQEVSRDLLWLPPDQIVVYDRARTLTANRAKRFWLNLPDNQPSVPTVNGNRVIGHTPGGQWLQISSVLPTARTLSIVTTDPFLPAAVNGFALGDEDSFIQTRTGPGGEEKYATRLQIEATGAPLDTRFLTVLDGTDANAAIQPTDLLQSIADSGCLTPAGSVEGVARTDQAIWFARDRSLAPTCLILPAPTRIQRMLITGLVPNAGYGLSIQNQGAEDRWVLSAGGSWQADAAGVLRVNRGPAPALRPRLSIDQDTLTFSSRYVGDSATLTLLLRNDGLAPSGPIAVAVASGNDFLVDETCPAAASGIAAGSECELRVRFSPQTAGIRRGQLSIQDGGVPTLTINLRGLAEPQPSVLFTNGFEN